MAVGQQNLVVLLALLEEEEAEFEGLLLEMARLGAAEIMAAEEGVGLGTYLFS